MRLSISVLPVAMQSMLDKHKTDLEWHVLVTQYGKEVETEKKEYMKKVAIPAFVGAYTPYQTNLLNRGF